MVKWKDAKVHFLTHTLHYGSGVFEGIRSYQAEPYPNVNGKKGKTKCYIFRLQDHLKRLEESAKIFEMPFPYSKEQLTKAIIKTVQMNKEWQCYIRPLLYYGYGEMGLSPKNSPIQLGIAVWPWEHYLGKAAQEKGAKVKVSTWVRNNPDAIPPKAKICGAYANSLLAKVEALENGFTDAVMLDSSGYITEGSSENLFVIRNGELLTPSLRNCLEGITRKSVIEIAKELKIPVREKEMTRDELYNADEAFFTGTAAEITPISNVDNRSIGNGKVGPITQQLQTAFTEIIHGKNPKFSHWLTAVK